MPMRRLALLLLPSLCTVAAAQTAPPKSSGRPSPQLADLRYLASDALGGRLTGSPGADSAAAYLARRFREAGLRPTEVGYLIPFTVNPGAPSVKGTSAAGARAQNVVGILPGSDRSLRAEAIVVGAHYDHLGTGPFGALDPDSTGAIHNGADDNASGASALAAIAEQLRKRKPRRTIVFVAFSGEELGLLGSAHYVRAPLWPLDRTVAMVNMDMIGRLTNERLIVYGVETAREFRPLLDSLNATHHFDLKAQGDGYGPSDQSSFYAAGMPVLHLFTDLHADYHRATDDADRINADGLTRVTAFAADLVLALANRGAPLTVVKAPPPPPPPVATNGAKGASLGSIPDMASGGPGVALTGVRAGSPADVAGIRKGDVIVKVGAFEVPDLQALSTALLSHNAGDQVTVVVLRDGSRLELPVTLGAPRGR